MGDFHRKMWEWWGGCWYVPTYDCLKIASILLHLAWPQNTRDVVTPKILSWDPTDTHTHIIIVLTYMWEHMFGAQQKQLSGSGSGRERERESGRKSECECEWTVEKPPSVGVYHTYVRISHSISISLPYRCVFSSKPVEIAAVFAYFHAHTHFFATTNGKQQFASVQLVSGSVMTKNVWMLILAGLPC